MQGRKEFSFRLCAFPLALRIPRIHIRIDVRQGVPRDISKGPDQDKPYFFGPRRYVKIPPNSIGPLFSQHNHDPAVVECPNGGLLAIWHTCDRHVCLYEGKFD